jgi:endonuclease/exonuclease/phosphatase (EEP) superfamily protein YafD
LRVVSLNMLHGKADPDAIVALATAADADVLALAEVTPASVVALRDAGIADRLPAVHVVAGPDDEPPGAGGAVWTRLEVRERTAVPGRFGQAAVRLSVPDSLDVEVTAVHTHPPTASAANVAAWEDDLRALASPAPGVLRVLAGDFNATLDHAALRAVLRRGWTDAAQRAGRGLSWTWRPLRLAGPRLTLDHVLVDRRISVGDVQLVHVKGSDHRALVVDLVLPRR